MTDILKILEKIPVWQTLSQLPKKVEALEKRVADLETALAAPKKVAGAECPMCQGTMKVTAVNPHPTFGRFGAQQRTHLCEGCGHTEERRFDPPKN